MSEQVIKTVENVDKLFSQIIRGKSNEYMHFAILEYTKTTD